MKALVLYEHKDQSVELRDVPIPEIGPRDILVKLKGAGVCGADIEHYHAFHENINPPVILGHEFCGVVDKVGKEVTRWKEGDRVVSDNTGYVCGECYACGTGQYLLCPERLGLGYGADGGFAEYVKISGPVLERFPKCLRRLPDNISFEEGAILEPCANSYYAIIQEGQLAVGQIAVIFGPGPIGLFAVALAKMGGASKIILVGGSPHRLDLGKKHGATHVINYHDTKDIPKAVAGIVGENKVDVALDCAGGATIMDDCFKMIRPAGRIVKVAWNKPVPVDLSLMMYKGATLAGHFGYNTISWDNVIRLAADKLFDFKSFVTGAFALDDWREAFQQVEDKKHIKAVFNSF